VLIIIQRSSGICPGLLPGDFTGIFVTYYCCVKQAIRAIDKTGTKQSELIFEILTRCLLKLPSLYVRITE